MRSASAVRRVRKDRCEVCDAEVVSSTILGAPEQSELILSSGWIGFTMGDAPDNGFIVVCCSAECATAYACGSK